MMGDNESDGGDDESGTTQIALVEWRLGGEDACDDRDECPQLQFADCVFVGPVGEGSTFPFQEQSSREMSSGEG